LLRDEGDLNPDQRLYREQLLDDGKVQEARRLAEGFGRIVRERDGEAHGAWLQEANSSGIGEFR
jgi:hypothetical protein